MFSYIQICTLLAIYYIEYVTSFVLYVCPKFQALSFTFKIDGFVLNVSKSCTLCPLGQTQFDFLVKFGHVQGT
ncbi:hypothetical protein Hanom_Chr11g00984651 [Helianthus anomalus]